MQVRDRPCFFDVVVDCVQLNFPAKKANNEDWILEMIMSYKIP